MDLPGMRCTTRGMMAAVAVLALDCFLLRVTSGGQGVLLIGTCVNIGLFRLWRACTTNPRFWFGFAMTGGAVTLAYVGCFWTDALYGRLPDALEEWPFNCMMVIHSYSCPKISQEIECLVNSAFSAHSTDWCSSTIILEATCGLPMLLLAAVGGIACQRLHIKLWKRNRSVLRRGGKTDFAQ